VAQLRDIKGKLYIHRNGKRVLPGPGRYADDETVGLYLQVMVSRATPGQLNRSWLFRSKKFGDMALALSRSIA
jgi:hypothetical protein